MKEKEKVSAKKREAKIFFSLPFKNRTEDEVTTDVKKMYKAFIKRYRNEFFDECDEVKFVTNWDYTAPADSKNPRANQVGEAIKRMSDCDIVLFHPDWKFAKGCEVEHLMCEIYKMPYINMEDI